MKGKYYAAISAIMLALPLFFLAFDSYNKTNSVTVTEPQQTVLRSLGGFISESSVSETDKNEYTIMIYMNGSDLESEYGAATDDLIEMAHSNFNGKNINLIIFTGGCKKWHTKGVPNNLNTVFQLKNKELIKLADAGDASMGEPYLLSGFIDFAVNNFPAEKYGLILWNHGGGAVVGYGADERYENIPDKAVMKLTDIDSALYAAGINEKLSKLEFLGFDTCLMSTVEMAAIASKYANYLVASEEVEPEQGWDYGFLGEITPGMDGLAIGKIIVDYYGDYYNNTDLDYFASLTLTDLSKIGAVVNAFENLSSAAKDALKDGKYNVISRARSGTRSFGSGGEDGETDMVDIGQMAMRLSRIFPQEGEALANALSNAVAHKYESRQLKTGGLSVYFPFYNKEDLEDNLQIYKQIGHMPNYTNFIVDFSEILTSRPTIQSFVRGRSSSLSMSANVNDGIKLTADQLEHLATVKITTWDNIGGGKFIQVGESADVTIDEDGAVSYANKLFTIDGKPACLYDTNNSGLYSVPITLNGEDANLLIANVGDVGDSSLNDKDGLKKWSSHMSVLGAIPTNNGGYNTVDKKLITVKSGDKIAIRYYCVSFNDKSEVTDVKEDEKWMVGPEFYVRGDLVLRKISNRKYIEKINLTDTQNNSHYITAA